ncbi:hypothetical protein WMY93_003012 [Mugilogobius chulae]|uniref:SUN domain-containing protein n=1 Tax=Mugilogobius chulae TaxID=88201 RepID=A0AAW0PVA8_9GOBI
MARRSERLLTMGYYNKDNCPKISYKESASKVKGRHSFSLTASDSPLVLLDVPAQKPQRILTWDMALLLIVTLFGFVGTYFRLAQLTAPQLKFQDSVLRTYQHKGQLHGEGATWLKQNNPGHVITGHNYPLTPGHCWAFSGQAGQLFISLAQSIHVSHVTLGHITKEQSPTEEIGSAPKTFTVYGLKDLQGPEIKLGTFHYDPNGHSFQTFRILQLTSKVFRFVRVHVQNNHGNPAFTCLYNFRVHGRIPTSPVISI